VLDEQLATASQPHSGRSDGASPDQAVFMGPRIFRSPRLRASFQG
jgi:hypothetical protein